jgi:hypothetical protein
MLLSGGRLSVPLSAKAKPLVAECTGAVTLDGV